MRQFAILCIPRLDVRYGLFIQGIRTCREVVLQRRETVFTHQVIHQLAGVRFGRIQLERILAFGYQARIVTIQLPVAAFDGLLHLVCEQPIPALMCCSRHGQYAMMIDGPG